VHSKFENKANLDTFSPKFEALVSEITPEEL